MDHRGIEMPQVDPCPEQRHGVNHHRRTQRRIAVTGERKHIMPKRVLDRFDIEAEREGNAISQHKPARLPVGKGITKQRNMHKRGQQINTSRLIKRIGVSIEREL